MRRPIFVYGCVLEDETVIDSDSPNITAVKVYPDKSVEITKPDGTVAKVEGKWVSYMPRFN